MLSIDGPIISTGELDRQLVLFEQVLGLARTADVRLDLNATESWLGLTDHAARVISLATPGSAIGVQLVQFSPQSELVIRVGGVGIASDALKMIDFFTNDRRAAAAAFRQYGFEPVSDGAPVDLPDGRRFTETHVKGPDGLMVAAIYPENVPARDYVSVTERLFSEVQSSSGPVSDFEPVRQFYVETLGLPLGLKYEFESPAFSSMIGAGETTVIRANNYGRIVEDVMLGIIHYGLPRSAYESLRDRARPPHRGVIGVRLTVTGIEALVARCAAAGYEIAVPLAVTTAGKLQTARTAVVRGPHGVWHFLVEPSERASD